MYQCFNYLCFNINKRLEARGSEFYRLATMKYLQFEKTQKKREDFFTIFDAFVQKIKDNMSTQDFSFVRRSYTIVEPTLCEKIKLFINQYYKKLF